MSANFKQFLRTLDDLLNFALTLFCTCVTLVFLLKVHIQIVFFKDNVLINLYLL